MNSHIEIYTDGACSGNPGAGGWAAILHIYGDSFELSGFLERTTNNRMELLAAIKALEHITLLNEKNRVNLHSDSKYLIDGMNLWIDGWRQRSWRGVKNLDLWLQLDYLNLKLNVSWIWVKAHADCADNNKADLLAKFEIIKNKKKTIDSDEKD